MRRDKGFYLVTGRGIGLTEGSREVEAFSVDVTEDGCPTITYDFSLPTGIATAQQAQEQVQEKTVSTGKIKKKKSTKKPKATATPKPTVNPQKEIDRLLESLIWAAALAGGIMVALVILNALR